jgi:hypothetical protein
LAAIAPLPEFPDLGADVTHTPRRLGFRYSSSWRRMAFATLSTSWPRPQHSGGGVNPARKHERSLCRDASGVCLDVLTTNYGKHGIEHEGGFQRAKDARLPSFLHGEEGGLDPVAFRHCGTQPPHAACRPGFRVGAEQAQDHPSQLRYFGAVLAEPG